MNYLISLIITAVVSPLLYDLFKYIIKHAFKNKIQSIDKATENNPHIAIPIAFIILFIMIYCVVYIGIKALPASNNDIKLSPTPLVLNEAPTITIMPSTDIKDSLSKTPSILFPTEEPKSEQASAHTTEPTSEPTTKPTSKPTSENSSSKQTSESVAEIDTSESVSEPTSIPVPTPITISDADIERVKLNRTRVYLDLSGINSPSEFDFNITNKVSGSKYFWISSNEDVAVVDEAIGLTTAVGIGSAEISAYVVFKDGTEKILSATVIVKDNIVTVAIANYPDRPLFVNEKYDFDRSFVTYAGSTTTTSSITRWKVDGYTATITDNGLFKAIEAGDYTITAMVFQSEAKYKEYLVSGDDNLILSSNEVIVTVTSGY